MATPNFSNKNASLVYAIEIQNDEDFDIIEEDLKNELQKIGFEVDIKEEWDNDRNYGGKILGKKQIWVDYKKDYSYSYILKAIMRSGYYSGVNLDWELTFMEVNGCVRDELDWKDIKDDCEWLEIKITDTIAKKMEEKIRNKVEKDIKKLEKLYVNISTPLNHIGTFSNGEAVYRKAKN